MLLLRGATLAAGAATSVSIHAPLARSNDRSAARRSSVFRFQHAPLARSNDRAQLRPFDIDVSIHAPLARSNRRRTGSVISIRSFNTCSSCEEQLSRVSVIPVTDMFQYMLLLRGATCSSSRISASLSFQYMLLARGATETMQLRSSGRTFQYMLLLRGATHHSIPAVLPPDVSIHAPLARSNSRRRVPARKYKRFNTCSSCEEQPVPAPGSAHPCRFNTCSSQEEQPLPDANSLTRTSFNTCSSQEEQRGRRDTVLPCLRFNTCSSQEEQHTALFAAMKQDWFQYMLLARGATSGALPPPEPLAVSIHAPRKRSNPAKYKANEIIRVSIHAPRKRSNKIHKKAPVLS